MNLNLRRALTTLFIGVLLLSGCSGTYEKNPTDMKVNTSNVDDMYKNIYDDDSKIIVGDYGTCHYSGYEDATSTEAYGKFSMFYGKILLWKISAKSQAKLALDFNSDQIGGKFKVVLVTPDDSVIKIIEQPIEGNKTIDLPVGESCIFIVGYNANLEYSISISDITNAEVVQKK